jgi:hypothetical protein
VPEIADVFREAEPVCRERHASRMLPSHRKAMSDIQDCRTEAMGGHVRLCEQCDQLRYGYHSCRNRHCPKCHGDQTRRWLEAQRARLLATPYYLLTFTLPSELRLVARANQKLVYSILMRTAAHALMKLAQDPRYLGTKPGILAVLHTWTRAMLYHPHVHFLVTAGGLSADGERWIKPRNPKFLVPCRALSLIFRAKFRDALEAAKLSDTVPATAWAKSWVVHAKHAGSGAKVLDYLARYVFRIAITNNRIERLDDSMVTFRYHDAKTKQTKRCTLPADQFTLRFLQHVLPRGFIKVRYYGLFSSACKTRLESTRSILENLQHPGPEPEDSEHQAWTRPDPNRCPVCNTTMRLVATVPRGRGPP